MFKKENQIWWYLLGCLIMFGFLALAAQNVVVPFLRNPTSLDLTPDFGTKPSFDINTELDYLAKVDTNYGSFTIDLFEKNAPQNVNNYVYLANKGYYTRTTFHRLIPTFLIQGGDRNTLNTDPSDDGKGKPGYFIGDEVNWDSLDLPQEQRTRLTELGYTSTPNLETPRFEKFTVAMANNGPNTNGSQFFIMISSVDDSRLRLLDGQFTPIGKVVSGSDVLDTIAKIAVDNPASNAPRPIDDIIVEQITIYTR